MFASSSAASTSSRTQNGTGRTSSIANSSATAVRARSPPDSIASACGLLARRPGHDLDAGRAEVASGRSATAGRSRRRTAARTAARTRVSSAANVVRNWSAIIVSSSAMSSRVVGDRRAQVGALRLERLEAGLELGVLVDGERVGGAELVVAAAQLGEPAGRRRRLGRRLGRPSGSATAASAASSAAVSSGRVAVGVARRVGARPSASASGPRPRASVATPRLASPSSPSPASSTRTPSRSDSSPSRASSSAWSAAREAIVGGAEVLAGGGRGPLGLGQPGRSAASAAWSDRQGLARARLRGRGRRRARARSASRSAREARLALDERRDLALGAGDALLGDRRGGLGPGPAMLGVAARRVVRRERAARRSRRSRSSVARVSQAASAARVVVAGVAGRIGCVGGAAGASSVVDGLAQAAPSSAVESRRAAPRARPPRGRPPRISRATARSASSARRRSPAEPRLLGARRVERRPRAVGGRARPSTSAVPQGRELRLGALEVGRQARVLRPSLEDGLGGAERDADVVDDRRAVARHGEPAGRQRRPGAPRQAARSGSHTARASSRRTPPVASRRTASARRPPPAAADRVEAAPRRGVAVGHRCPRSAAPRRRAGRARRRGPPTRAAATR